MNMQLLDNALGTSEVEEKLNAFQQWFVNSQDYLIGLGIKIVAALVIFLVGWWLIKIVLKLFVKAMKRARADKTVISFLNSIIGAALRILLIICVISTLGFDVTTLITAIGAAAVTVGLALKDSLSNVASGTLIILNKKFRTGDFIETEGIIGEVIKIEMMYTTLRTYDYKEVMIPNSRLTTNNVINHFSLDIRRADIPVPIPYGQDIEKAREVIMKTVLDHELVLKDKNNKVYVDKFDESSVNINVWAWCRSKDYWKVLFELREEIKKALDEAGIEIPFNQLDVHFDYPDSAVEQLKTKENREAAK